MRSPVSYVIQLYNALNEVEQKVFLDQVDPQPEQEAPVKKTRKKRGSRSPQVEGMARAIQSSLQRNDAAPKADAPKNDGQLCTAIVPGLGVVCGETADKLIHDPKGGYGGYHPFSLVAPIVVPKSPRKSRSTKASESSTPNTEVEMESATAVASGN